MLQKRSYNRAKADNDTNIDGVTSVAQQIDDPTWISTTMMKAHLIWSTTKEWFSEVWIEGGGGRGEIKGFRIKIIFF